MKLITSLAIIWSYCIFQIGYVHLSGNANPTTLDQERPYAFCISELKINLMDVTGVATLNAADIEAGLSSDNSTSYRNLRFSFSQDTNDTKRLFDCNDVGNKTIELWVSDEAGNQDYCTTRVLIVDPHEVCGMSTRTSSLAMR